MSKAKKARPVSGRIADKFNATLATVRGNALNEGSSFRLLVASCKEVKASKLALAKFDAEYIVGRVAATLSYDGDNRTDEQRYQEAEDIIALKPAKTEKKPDGSSIILPDSQQPDGHRVAWQQRALGAARKSLVTVHTAAGIKAKRGGGRAPRPGTNPPETNEPPRDMVFASPKLANDNAARDYFRNAFAALLTTASVNRQTGVPKDVKHVAFTVQSIIADAKLAIEKALA